MSEMKDKAASMWDPCFITATYKLAHQILLNMVFAGKPDVKKAFALAEEFERVAMSKGHMRDFKEGEEPAS